VYFFPLFATQLLLVLKNLYKDHKQIIKTGVQTCWDLCSSACCNSRSDNGVPFHGRK